MRSLWRGSIFSRVVMPEYLHASEAVLTSEARPNEHAFAAVAASADDEPPRLNRDASSSSAFANEKTRHMPIGRAKGKEGPENQVDSDRRVSGLHLGNPRLARTKASRHLDLCQSQTFTQAAQTLGKRELGIQQSSLFERETQEVACIAELPARPLKSPAFVSLRHILKRSGARPA